MGSVAQVALTVDQDPVGPVGPCAITKFTGELVVSDRLIDNLMLDITLPAGTSIITNSPNTFIQVKFPGMGPNNTTNIAVTTTNGGVITLPIPPAGSGPPGLNITEIFWDAPFSDQWVELVNNGSMPVDLCSGMFSFKDTAPGATDTFNGCPIIVQPGEIVVITPNGQPDPSAGAADHHVTTTDGDLGNGLFVLGDGYSICLNGAPVSTLDYTFDECAAGESLQIDPISGEEFCGVPNPGEFCDINGISPGTRICYCFELQVGCAPVSEDFVIEATFDAPTCANGMEVPDVVGATAIANAFLPAQQLVFDATVAILDQCGEIGSTITADITIENLTAAEATCVDVVVVLEPGLSVGGMSSITNTIPSIPGNTPVTFQITADVIGCNEYGISATPNFSCPGPNGCADATACPQVGTVDVGFDATQPTIEVPELVVTHTVITEPPACAADGVGQIEICVENTADVNLPCLIPGIAYGVVLSNALGGFTFSAAPNGNLAFGDIAVGATVCMQFDVTFDGFECEPAEAPALCAGGPPIIGGGGASLITTTTFTNRCGLLFNGPSVLTPIPLDGLDEAIEGLQPSFIGELFVGADAHTSDTPADVCITDVCTPDVIEFRMRLTWTNMCDTIPVRIVEELPRIGDWDVTGGGLGDLPTAADIAAMGGLPGVTSSGAISTMPQGGFTGATIDWSGIMVNGDGTFELTWSMTRTCDCSVPAPGNKCTGEPLQNCMPCCVMYTGEIFNGRFEVIVPEGPNGFKQGCPTCNCFGCEVAGPETFTQETVANAAIENKDPNCGMPNDCDAACVKYLEVRQEDIGEKKPCEKICFTSTFNVMDMCGEAGGFDWSTYMPCPMVQNTLTGYPVPSWDPADIVVDVGGTPVNVPANAAADGGFCLDFSSLENDPAFNEPGANYNITVDWCVSPGPTDTGTLGFGADLVDTECYALRVWYKFQVKVPDIDLFLTPIGISEPCAVTTAEVCIVADQDCILTSAVLNLDFIVGAGSQQSFAYTGGTVTVTDANGAPVAVTPVTTDNGTSVGVALGDLDLANGLCVSIPLRGSCALDPTEYQATLTWDTACPDPSSEQSGTVRFDPLTTAIFRPLIEIITDPPVELACATNFAYDAIVINNGSGGGYDLQIDTVLPPSICLDAAGFNALYGPGLMATTNATGGFISFVSPVAYPPGSPLGALEDRDGTGLFNDLPPGQLILLRIPVNIKGCVTDTFETTATLLCSGNPCDEIATDSKTFIPEPPSLITTALFPSDIAVCESTKVVFVVDNPKKPANYNVVLTQHLPEHITYCPGSVTFRLDPGDGTGFGAPIAGADPTVGPGSVAGGTDVTFDTNAVSGLAIIPSNGMAEVCFYIKSSCEAFNTYGPNQLVPIDMDSSYEDFCGNPFDNQTFSSAVQLRAPDIALNKIPDGRVVDIQTINTYTIRLRHRGTSTAAVPYLHLCDTLDLKADFCATDIEGIGPIADPDTMVSGPGGTYDGTVDPPTVTFTNGWLQMQHGDANGDGQWDPGEGTIAIDVTGILKACNDPINCVDLYYGCLPDPEPHVCAPDDIVCFPPLRDCGTFDTSPEPEATGPGFRLNVTPCGGEKCITWTNVGATMTNISISDTSPAGFIYDTGANVTFAGEWAGSVPVTSVSADGGYTMTLDIDALCAAGVFGTPPAIDNSNDSYANMTGASGNQTGNGPMVQKVEFNFQNAVEICVPLIPDPNPPAGFASPFDCEGDPTDLDFNDPLGPTLFFPDEMTEICFFPLCPGPMICEEFNNNTPAEYPQPDVDLQPNSFIVTPGGVQNFCVTIENNAQVSDADNIVSITCLDAGWMPVTPGDVTSITQNITFGTPGTPAVTTYPGPNGTTCLKVDLTGAVLGPSDNVVICFDATSAPNSASTRVTTEMTTACGDPVSAVLIANNPCGNYPNTEGDGPFLYDAPGGGNETIYNIDQDRAFGIGLLQDKTVKYPDEPDSAFRTNLNARVGECLVYRLTWQIWGADFNNVVLSDTLPVGWILDAASPIIIVSNENSQGVSVPLSFSAAGQTIMWSAGNLPQEFYTFVIDVPIKVANVAANNNCDYKFNEATISFDVDGFDTPLPAVSNKVHVVEGFLNIMKMPEPCDVLEFGESVVYTVTVDMEAMSNTCVYDIVISDALPPSLVMTPFGTDGLDNDGDGLTDEADEAGQLSGQNITIDSSNNPQLAMWCPGDPPLVIQYEGELAGVIIPGVEITNTATVIWDSLPDGYPNDSEERDGTDTGPNDYLTNDVKVITSIVEFAMSKSLVGSSEPYTALDMPTIGERLIYSVRIDVPSAGIMPRFQVIDDLPLGLDFAGCDPNGSLTFPGIGYSIVVPPGGPTFVGANASSPLPFDPAFGAGGGNPWPSYTDEDPTPCNNVNGDGNGDRIRWRFESQTAAGGGADYIENVQDNDPSNDYFEILYEVIVKDIPSNFDWETLTNAAEFRFGGDDGNPRDLFEPGETNITDSVDVMITEPKLTLDKSMEIMDDMIIITLVVSNDAGGSSAFDINIVDDLMWQCFVPGSAMAVQIPRDYSFIVNSPSPNNPAADQVQITTNSSQTFQDRELLPGDTITFVFKASITVDDQGPIQNTATITEYSSIDGDDPWERIGDPVSDSATLDFGSYSISKTLIAPTGAGGANVTDPNSVVFEITVSNTSTQPTNIFVNTLVDTFDPAVLQYVSDTSGATPSISGGVITWTFAPPPTVAMGGTFTFEVTFDPIASTTPDWSTNLVEAAVSTDSGDLPEKGDTARVWTFGKGIEVFKSIADDECLCTGTETIDAFEITLVNTGDVAVTNINVVDVQYPACDMALPTLLILPGDTFSYTCSVTLDPAITTNQVEATADIAWYATDANGDLFIPPDAIPMVSIVRVENNCNDQLNILEIEILDASGANAALAGTAFSPDGACSGSTFAGVIDGNVTAGCCGQLWHSCTPGPGVFIDITLPAPTPVTQVNVLPRIGCCPRLANYFLVFFDAAGNEIFRENRVNGANCRDGGGDPADNVFDFGLPECTVAATNGINFLADTNKPVFVFRPNPTASFECIDEVPIATTNEVYVIDDCMNGLMVTVAVTTNDATGCPINPTLVSNVWTATDGCGNVCAYTQVVTVVDTTELKIVAPDDLELGCFPTSGLLAGQLPPPGNDLTLFWMQGGKAIFGCSAGIVFREELRIGDCGLRTLIRTYSLTNACYTDVSDTQTITYFLGNTPVITCPPDQDLGCLQSTNIFHGMQLAPAVSDCPGTLVYTDVVTQAGCIYTATRTWTARGQCSSGAGDQEATCDVVYTFTIDEEEPKFVDIPADRDLGCYDGALTEAAITNFVETLAPLAADLAAVVSSDNCNNEQVLFDCNHVTNTACGVQLNRRLKIIDACGNQVVEDIVYTLTIDDGTPPTVTALDDVDLECIFAVSQIPQPITTLVDADDPCGIASITHMADAELGTPCEGDLERVYEITDDCGNTATVTQHFLYVIDTVFPKITNMPPDTFLGCLADDAAAMAVLPSVAADMAQVLASNECDVVTTHMGDVWSTNGCTVSISRSFMVTDECNNIDVRAVVYTYTATPAPPTLTGPATLDLGCIQGCAQLPAPNVGQFTAGSTCSVGPVTYVGESSISLAGGDLCGMAVERTYSVTDECDQTTTFVQTLLFSLDVTPSITAVEAGGDMGCQPCGTHPATNLTDLAFADFFDHICNEVPAPGLAYEYWNLGGNTLLADFFGGAGVTPAQAPDATGTVTANLFDDDALRTQEDRYMLRWTGFINITTPGTYFFDTESDDGSRLYINGNLIVDNDGFHGRQRRDGQATLGAGCHAVEIQFSEATGGDFVELRWNGPDSGNTRQLIPDAAFLQNCCVGCVASCTEAAGLTADVWGSNAGASLATFFGGAGNTPPSLVSTVAVPGLTHGDPASFDPDGNGDNFTVRWRGFIKVPACGDYTFYTTSDDGSMIYINGNLVVNNDGNHGNRTREGTVTLEKGCHAFELQFFESGSGQNIVSEWESADAGVARQQIPNSVLFTECCPDSPADFTPEELMDCGFLTVTDVVSTNDAACQVIIDRTYRLDACCGNFAEESTSFSYTKIPSADAGVLADIDAGCIPSTNVISTTAAYLINASSSCDVVTIDFLRTENVVDTQCVDSFDRVYIVETLCGVFATVTQTVSYVLESGPPRITGIIGFEDFGCIAPGTVPRTEQEELDSITSIDDVAVISTNLVSELFSTNDCEITIARTYRVEDCCGNAHELATSFSYTPIPDAPVVSTLPADIDAGCITALGQIPPIDLTTVAIDADCPIIDIRFNGEQNQADGFCESSFERVYTVETLCDVTTTFTQNVTYCLDTAPPEFVALPAYTNFGCVAADPRTLADDLAAIVATDDKTVVRTQLIMEVRSVQDCEILVERTWRVEDCCGKFDTKQSSYAYTLSPTNLVVTAPAGQDLGCIPDLGQIPAPNLSGVGTTSSGVSESGCQTAVVTAVADAYVRGNTVPSGFGQFLNNIVWSETGVQDTKTYMKFDVSALPILPSITTPSLKFTVDMVPPNAPGISGFPATIDVYGLNDGDAGEGWGETTIDWNNAPQNDQTLGAGVLGGTTLVGSVPVVVGANGAITLTGPALAAFLNADTDGSVTFILVAGNPTSLEMFVAARESATPPALCYESCVDSPADAACPAATVTHEGDTVVATTNCTDYLDRVFRVTDLCGLSVITTQRITYAFNAQSPQIAAVSNFVDYSCVDVEPRPLSVSSNALVVVDDNTALITTQLVNEVRLTNNCQVTVTRTWRVEDCCGAFGTADETYRYTIRPSGATVAALADLPLGCIPDLGQIPQPNTTLVQAQSDCSIVSITHSEDLPTNSIDACIDSFERVYLVEDLCGATTPVTQLISYVFDSQNPRFDAVAPFEDYGCFLGLGGGHVLAGDDPRPLSVSSNALVASDDHALLTFSLVNEVRLTNNCQVTVTRSWRVEDCCGKFDLADETYQFTIQPSPATVAVLGPLDLGCINDIGQVPQPNTTLVSAQSDCSIVAITHLRDDPSDGGYCTETFGRVYQIEDLCANLLTVTQQISFILNEMDPMILDTEAPVDFGCQDLRTWSLPLPDAAATNAVVAMDANLVSTQWVGDVHVTNGCDVTVTRTWRVEDCCGKKADATVTFTYVVQPESAPVISGQNLLPLGCITSAGLIPLPSTSSLTVQSGCAGWTAAHLEDRPATTSGCLTSFERVYIATDRCGQSSTWTQTISYTEDAQDPVFVSIPADDDFGCQINDPIPPVFTNIIVGADDTLVLSTTLVAQVRSTNNCVVTEVRTWELADCCGNTTEQTVTYQYTPQSTAGPSITAPAQLDLGCIASASQVSPPSPATANASADCGIATITWLGDSAPVTVGCLTTMIRTYQATDNCNVSNIDTQVITYTVDALPPVFTSLPADDDFGCVDTDPVTTDTTLDVAATDESQVIRLGMVSETRATNDCNVTVVRTFEAEDCCGRITSGQTTYTFTWRIAPAVIAGNATLNLGCIPSAGLIPGPSITPLNASSGCPIQSFDFLQDTTPTTAGCLTSFDRLYQVLDNCGQPTVFTQVVSYTVDLNDPTIDVPAGQDFGCVDNDPLPVPNTNAVTTTDDSVVIRTEMVDEARTTNGCDVTVVRTWEAEDCCGKIVSDSATFTFTWRLPPALISGQANIDLGCIANTAAIPMPNTTPLSATSGCSIDNFNHLSDAAATQNGCVWSFERSYEVIDNCGQQSVFVQTYTYILDAQAPAISSVPAGQDFGCQPATFVMPAPDAAATGAVVAVDDLITRVEWAGDTYATNVCGVTITRIWEAEDCCNNIVQETAVSTFTVLDAPPTVDALPVLDLGCINDLGQVPQANTATVSAQSGCPLGGITHTGDTPTLNDPCASALDRVYTVTDNCGQTATVTQRVTWTIDTELPKVTSTQSGGNLGCAPVTIPAVDLSQVTATDNCGVDTIVWHCDITNVLDCVTTITRIYRVTDNCGNQVDSSVLYTYTTDSTPPQIGLPFGFEADLDLGCNPLFNALPPVDPSQFSVADDCGTVAVIHESDSFGSNGCAGVLTRVYSAIDSCGNRSEVVQTIAFIVDVERPTPGIVPANLDIGCDPASIPGPNAAVFGVTGMCSTLAETNVFEETTTSAGCQFTMLRTYELIDDCGNRSTADQTITWTESEVSTISCPPDVTLPCNALPPAPNPALASATGCGIGAVTHAGDLPGPGVLFRVFEATDNCGNTISCTQTYSFASDGSDPVITSVPQGGDLGCNPTSLPVASPSDITATDDSGMASTSVVLVATNMDGCVGELLHRYRVVDACGNDAEVQVNYTFTVDTTPPEITCPDSEFRVQVNEFCETFYPAIFPILTDDNCNGDIRTFQDPPAGALIMGPGVYPTTVFAVDACGNTNSCTVPVLVEGDCIHSGIPGKVPNVGIELTKTVYAGHSGGAGCATAGELVDSVIGAPVTYCFIIENTGDTGLDLIFLEDRDLIPAILRDVTNFLDMGETVMVFEETFIDENLTNTASVVAFPSIGGPQVSDVDTAVVLGGDPSIDIQKSVLNGHNAACPGVELIDGNAGDPVTYCFLVTNTGDVDLQNVRVTDAQIGANITIGTLTAGQSTTVSHNGQIIGPVNTASVSGETSSGTVVSNTDDAHARLGCGCVSGAVFNDLNNDGLVVGENLANVGIAGVLVRITRTDTGTDIPIDTVNTGADGTYQFNDLVSGTYRVEIDPATVPELLRDSLANALPVTVERGICECNVDLDGTSFAGVPAPTAIELERLLVTPTAEGNLVEWTTSWEDGVLGYNLLDADGQQLNEGLILASGGGAYQFLDAGAQTGSYELQEVTNDLGLESHGSVEVLDAAPSGEPTQVVTAEDNHAAFTAVEGIATYLVFEFEQAPVARSGTTAFRGQLLEVDGKFGLYLSVEPGTDVVVK